MKLNHLFTITILSIKYQVSKLLFSVIKLLKPQPTTFLKLYLTLFSSNFSVFSAKKIELGHHDVREALLRNSWNSRS